MKHDRPSLTAFEKRIKRHIIGRAQRFFVITSPGIEKLCVEELMQLQIIASDVSLVNGGIEFTGRLYDCYLANLNLRLASRILMRIDHFKAPNFPRLQKKIAAIPWELYLFKGSARTIQVTSKHSRLYHRDAVAEWVQRAIAKRLGESGIPAPSDSVSRDAQQIYVRIIGNECTVSIDSSGELLHKRGIKTHHAAAPLRETLAAAILRYAGFSAAEPLIDPLCGSGTFSLEAAMMIKKIPAGWFREFAFMQWPCFRSRQWQYIRSQCEPLFVNPAQPQVFASDVDEQACEQLSHSVARYNFSDVVRVRCKDFFQLNPRDLTTQKGLVVLNPPYGLRIGSKKNTEELFKTIGKRLSAVYAGWKVALISPDAHMIKYVPCSITHQSVIYHGGCRIFLFAGKIQEQY